MTTHWDLMRELASMYAAYASDSTGSKTVNVAPMPAWERTSMVPPWFSMMRWLMGRPRPVPFSLVVKNGMNRLRW